MATDTFIAIAKAHAAREFGFQRPPPWSRFRRPPARRAERIFDQGDLRIVILKADQRCAQPRLRDTKAIEEKVGGALFASPA